MVEELKDNLNKIIKNLNKINLLLKIYQRLEKEDKLKFAYRLEEILNNINKKTKDLQIPSLQEKINNFFITEKNKIETYKEEVKRNFGVKLAETLKSCNLPLTGQYPNLYVGLYTLKLDFDNNQIKLFWGPEYIKKIKLDVDTVKEAILGFEEELKSRKFSPTEFLQTLKKAYYLTINMKASPANKILLTELLCELAFLLQGEKFREEPIKSNFTSYSRAYFGYDLYRLKTSLNLSNYGIILHTATFDKTKDRKNVIFIPTNNFSGNYYSYISISA